MNKEKQIKKIQKEIDELIEKAHDNINTSILIEWGLTDEQQERIERLMVKLMELRGDVK